MSCSPTQGHSQHQHLDIVTMHIMHCTCIIIFIKPCSLASRRLTAASRSHWHPAWCALDPSSREALSLMPSAAG